MKIYENILAEITTQMKLGNYDAISFLRYLNAQCQNKAMALNSTIIDDDIVIAICKTEAKKIQEEMQFAKQSGNSSIVNKTTMQQMLLDIFLPVMIDETTTRADATTIIAELNVTSMKQMGKVIAALKAKHGSLLDTSIASKIVKEMLA
jgi:uncharacterized protein YqeY